MNLLLLLQLAAESLSDRIAVGGTELGLSYADLLRRARNFGDTVSGVDAVAFCGVNSTSFPIALFGAAAAGRPFAPLNYRLPDEDLRKIAARTAPSLLIADDEVRPRFEGLAGVRTIGRSDFLAMSTTDKTWQDIETPADAVGVLLFTSGTTGEPKAALLRHSHLASYVMQTVEFLGASEDEAILVSVPPYHIAAVSSVLTSIYAGRRIVQLPAFDPVQWVKAALMERVTHAMLVPTMLSRVVHVLHSERISLPDLRHLSYGGGRMPASLILQAMEVLPHVDFVNAYGLTETSSTIAVLTPDDHREAHRARDDHIRRRLGSVGRPVPSVEVEVRDSRGFACRANAAGEIWVRGDQVSGEYVGKKIIRDDGWMPTNDSGWFDEDGYLFIEGRLDDVIVRGGENISPGEIEDLIRTHPAVRDVAVIGLPDDEWGEKIAAVLVTDGEIDEDLFRGWIRERLRSTKVPQEIMVRDALPYNDLGKLLRRELKRQYAGGSR